MNVAEAFAADVAAQPQAFERLADLYASADSPLRALRWMAGVKRLRFVGVGSSAYGCLTAVSALRACGVDAAVELPERDAATPPHRDLTMIFVSASGRSPETLAAAELYAGVSRTIAVTNEPDSPLAAMSDEVLPLAAGEERGGVACRTFRATVAVSGLIAQLVAGVRPDLHAVRQAADASAALLSSAERGWLDDGLTALSGAASISVAAPALHRGSALQAALMFRECPRIPADGYATSEWSHVGVYLTVHPDHRAVLFTGGEYETELFDWTHRRSVPVVCIGHSPHGRRATVPAPSEAPLDALVSTIATDLLAARMWAERSAANDR